MFAPIFTMTFLVLLLAQSVVSFSPGIRTIVIMPNNRANSQPKAAAARQADRIKDAEFKEMLRYARSVFSKECPILSPYSTHNADMTKMSDLWQIYVKYDFEMPDIVFATLIYSFVICFFVGFIRQFL
jgi:hypothetical protein